MDPLTRVARSTKRRTEAEHGWRDAIRAARYEGASFRSIASAAGISHVRVIQILREPGQMAQ